MTPSSGRVRARTAIRLPPRNRRAPGSCTQPQRRLLATNGSSTSCSLLVRSVPEERRAGGVVMERRGSNAYPVKALSLTPAGSAEPGRIAQQRLFDVYGRLLTERQREACRLY